MRQGQEAFNNLHMTHPDIAREIQGTEYDPFYDDSKLETFNERVTDMLGDDIEIFCKQCYQASEEPLMCLLCKSYDNSWCPICGFCSCCKESNREGGGQR